MLGTCYKTSASYLALPILLHRPRQFVILGLVLIGCLQACSSIDHGSADTAKPGYTSLLWAYGKYWISTHP